MSRAPTTSLSPSGVCAHLAGDAGLQFKTDPAVTSIKADRRWEGRPQACGEPGGGVAPGLRPASPPAAGHQGRRGVAPRGSGPATEAVGVSAATSGALRHAPRPKLRRGRPRLGPRPVLCSRDQEARRPLPHLVPCPHWAAHSANVYGRQGRAWAGSGPRRHKPSSWP